MAEMEFKGTPGPWHSVSINNYAVWSPDCKVVDVMSAIQGEGYRVPDKSERAANGFLIAASLDLLEALQGAIGALEQDLDAGKDSGDSDWEGLAYQRLEAARAAIAKALQS